MKDIIVQEQQSSHVLCFPELASFDITICGKLSVGLLFMGLLLFVECVVI